MANFSERFKELRTILGWTQEQAAKEFGISRGTVAGYEANNRVPREETLKKIANRFNVSVDYLLGRIDEDYLQILKESRESYFGRSDVLDSYESNLSVALEHLLKLVSENDQILPDLRADIINTLQLFNIEVFDGFFSSVDEVRAIFYGFAGEQSSILSCIYNLIDIESNQGARMSKRYVEALYNHKLYPSLFDHYSNLIAKMNSGAEDYVVVFNPLHEYLKCYDLLSNNEFFENCIDNIHYFAKVSSPENSERSNKMASALIEELNKIRSNGPIKSVNAIRTINGLITNSKKTHISADEAEFLAQSLQMYRTQKEKWETS